MNTLDEQILKRIEETKELLNKVVNKTTLTYLKVLKSLKEDYEAINDNTNACDIADKIIYTINHNDYDNKYILDIDSMLLSSYDTKARNGDFKSYCIALEWKRPIHKQYFLPRMKLLEKHGVVQAFQDLQDDKLDLMVLNLPPRVGKLLADNTPILTTKGWKTHGELTVEDEVFNHKGDKVRVLGISQPSLTTHVVTFANGEQIECHENHEWLVYDRHSMKNRVLETKYIMDNLYEKDGRNRFLLPERNEDFHFTCKLPLEYVDVLLGSLSIPFTDISRVETPSQGRCIQVEGGVYLAGKQLIPTHNSTLSLFFLSFRAGLYPDESILGNGHSTSLTQSFYNELLNIMTGEEYRYIDIFNNGQIVSKSAEYAWVDLGKDKRFHTLNFKSVDGGTTGLVEASNLLYCDDLVKDVETANNPERLEKLYYTYTSTIKDRKVNRLCKDGVYRTCPELHVNTPWSINDPTNRVIRGEIKKGNNERVRIISIPCWNDNKESNFLYDYGKGFDTKYYEDMEQAEDPVIFSAKYLMKCIEREGRPFTEDQLNFFYDLPSEKADRIISYSDVSFGGDDYFSMPVAYIYDHDVYIEDVMFVNKVDPDKSRPMVCNKIIQHKIERAGFEQNNGGMLYATLVEGDLKRKNYRCNITTHNAPSNSSKRDRILACQSEIKGIATEFGNYRFFFKEYSKRKDNAEYCAFMSNIYNWSQKAGSIQTTQHDDAPDSLAGLIINLLGAMTAGKAQSRVSRKQLGY